MSIWLFLTRFEMEYTGKKSAIQKCEKYEAQKISLSQTRHIWRKKKDEWLSHNCTRLNVYFIEIHSNKWWIWIEKVERPLLNE